jgi:hypothetical protein
LGIRRTSILLAYSLLMSASSLQPAPHLINRVLQCRKNAPLLRTGLRLHIQSFGIRFNRQSFSAQGVSMSQLLRTI